MPPPIIHFSVLGFEQYFVNFNSLQLHFEQFEVHSSPLLFILSLFSCNFPEYYCSSSWGKLQMEVSFHVFLKSHTTVSDFQWLLFSSICTMLSFHKRMVCILVTGVPRNVCNLVLYSSEDWTQILLTLNVK